MAPAVGDSVSSYHVYSSSADGPANKGVPLVFDFGEAAPSITGERVAVSVSSLSFSLNKHEFHRARSWLAGGLLRNKNNRWFILLSHSCLPLVGFSALAERLRLEYQMRTCDLHTPKAHV